MQSVKGLNVLVTGAAMGLGKLFATNAVKEGRRRWCCGTSMRTR